MHSSSAGIDPHSGVLMLVAVPTGLLEFRNTVSTLLAASTLVGIFTSHKLHYAMYIRIGSS